jgi:[methyl-Co(III) methanol-specific corrinoid protein]:coenzyme M methyltransferase
VEKMKKYEVRRNVFSRLLGKKTDLTPVTSIAGCGGTATVSIQKASGIYCPEAHKESDSMTRLAIASSELTGIENARVPFDFVVEAEALGCTVRWADKPESLPSISKTPYKSPEDLKMPENLTEIGRIPVVLESIRLLREQVGDYLPITSLVVGPVSLAGELTGIMNLLLWTRRNPNYLKPFIDFATEFVITYAKEQYRAGADILLIADPTASLSLISPTIFREFALPKLKEVSDNLGGIRVLHVCGRTKEIIPELVETGFDAYSLEEDISLIKSIDSEIRLLGNISSKKTLITGSVEDVKQESMKALEAGVDLLEPDCGLSPLTPLENIRAMVQARDEFHSKL